MAEIISFQDFKRQEPHHLVGRILMLNVASPELTKDLVKRFQCGGFSVNTRKMMDRVTEEAQLEPLELALEKGVLVDVTDNLPPDALAVSGSKRSKVLSEETGSKVFVHSSPNGTTFLYAPKSKEEMLDIERQIAETGTFELPSDAILDDSGLSKISKAPMSFDEAMNNLEVIRSSFRE